MNEWSEKKLDTLKLFSKEYGKVFLIFSLLVIILMTVYYVIILSTLQPLQVSFLDVGQGDAILIQTPSGKSMLVDGGMSPLVLERLARKMSYFDRTIDVMVATHPDADHVTGLIPVLEKYDIKTILISTVKGDTKIFSELEQHVVSEHAKVYVAHKGDVIDFHDGVTAEILHPSINFHEKKNDTNSASVSMVITYGGKSFLLTGDLPTTEEDNLLNKTLPKNITVYKAGHHGSKYSSGEQLLTYIKPEYSVVSAGKDNRYGHPNSETIDRLQKYSKEILSTIDRGTISFVTDGKMLKVMTSK